MKSAEKAFVGKYKLTRNFLHSDWESLISLFSEGKGTCLDVGCGDGRHRVAIEAKGYYWIGCDVAENHELDKSVRGDALYLPFKSCSFDAVFSNCVLEHMRDPFLAMNEIARVLKPKGRVFLQVAFMEPFHGSYFHISHWGLEELARLSNLRIIQIEPGATAFVPIWTQLIDIVGVSTHRYIVPLIIFFIDKLLRIFGYVGIRLFCGKKSWQFEKYQGYFDRLPLKIAGQIKCIAEKPYYLEGNYRCDETRWNIEGNHLTGEKH